jgi:hypothetical protein
MGGTSGGARGTGGITLAKGAGGAALGLGGLGSWGTGVWDIDVTGVEGCSSSSLVSSLWSLKVRLSALLWGGMVREGGNGPAPK